MAEPLNFDYDKESDVLYVSLGRPRRAISREADGGVIVRFDLKTRKVVGFTIINFLRGLSARNRELRALVSGELTMSHR